MFADNTRRLKSGSIPSAVDEIYTGCMGYDADVEALEAALEMVKSVGARIKDMIEQKKEYNAKYKLDDIDKVI